MGDVEKHNEQIVRHFFATLSTGKLENLRPLLHKDATWDIMVRGIPGAGLKRGHKEILDDFLGPARGTFVEGDPKIHVEHLIAQGPCVAIEARGTGHFKNGKEYLNQYAFFVEIKDDKVFRLHEYMDSYYISTLV